MAELLQQLAFVVPAPSRVEEFSALVERHSSFVFKVAYAILRNAHDADDVVQETFLKLYRAQRWREIENERGFLARAAWRLALDRRRARRPEELDEDLCASGRSPEEAAISADWSAVVHRLMDALPEEFRQPLALSTVEEMTSKQIAAVMGIPEGTVRSRLSRARQLLREKLEKFMAGPNGK